MRSEQVPGFAAEANAVLAVALPSTRLSLCGKDEIIVFPSKEGHSLLSNGHSRI